MRASMLRERLCAFIGFAFYCAMLRPPFLGSLATDSLPNPEAMRISFDATAILIGVALLSLPFAKRFTDRENQTPLRVITLAAPVSIAAICFAQDRGFSAGAFYDLCFAALCLGFASLTTCWFNQLSTLPRPRVVAFFLGAFVASHLVGLVDLLPRETAALVSITYPLSSLVALILCGTPRFRRVEAPHRDEGRKSQAIAEEFAAVMPSSPHQRRFFKRLRFLALSIIFIEVACGAFIRSAYSRGGINYTLGSHTEFTYFVSAAIGLGLLLIARKTRTATECTLAVGGTGLVGFALITGLMNVLDLDTLIPFITGLYSALIVFMMALILLWRTDGDRAIASCAGTFLLLYGTASSITATIVPLLLSYQGRMPSEYLAPMGAFAGTIVAFGVAVALAAMVFVQRETFLEVVGGTHHDDEEASRISAHDGTRRNDADGVGPSGEAVGAAALDPNELHDKAIAILAARFGLTEREKQTAALIARGYTAKRVAENMTVAVSTVQGYCKSIYRKLGIHRKDELIEAANCIEQELRDAAMQGDS